MGNTELDKFLIKLAGVVERGISEFYLQSLYILFSFALAYLIYKLACYLIPPIFRKRNAENTAAWNMLRKYAVPLFYPLLTILLTAISAVIYSQFYRKAVLFSAGRGSTRTLSAKGLTFTDIYSIV